MAIDLVLPHRRATTARPEFGSRPDPEERRVVTVLELIDQALERNTADAAFLASLVLNSFPSDYGSLRRGLQELVLAEIGRRLAGGAAVVIEPAPTPAPERFSTRPRGRGAQAQVPAPAAQGTKWAEAAAVANDPLQAQVLLRGVFVPWADLTADDLRLMAQDDERQATKLLERGLRLDALARDMEAAGALRLADLPGAAARIGGL